MCALLTQYESYGAIDFDYFPKMNTDTDKKKIKKKAYTTLILNLSDKVLKEVSHQITLKRIIFKLDY